MKCVREGPAHTDHLRRRVLLQPTLQDDDLNLWHFTDAIIIRQEQTGTKFYCCSDLDSIRGTKLVAGAQLRSPRGQVSIERAQRQGRSTSQILLRLFKKFSPLNGKGFQQTIDVVHVCLEEPGTHFKKSWGTFCASGREVR